jgi:hypothetical protein
MMHTMADDRASIEKRFAEEIEKLASVQPRKVVETYTIGGGTKPFADLRDEVVRIQQLASAAKMMSVGPLPLHTLADVAQATANMNGAINSIGNFNPGTNPDHSARLRQDFPQKCKAFCDAAAVLFSIDAARHVAELVDLKQVFASAADEEMAKILDKSAEADKVLEALRKMSTEAAVSREARHFANESNAFKFAARVWLGLTIGMMFLIGIGLAYMYYNTPPAATSGIVVAQQIAAKVILLSLAFGLVVFFGRNYATSRHNFIINKHRATALLTFEAFVTGTADAETKNAVLVAAARSIFAPQATGYLRKDAVHLGGPLLEMLKSAGGVTWARMGAK